jgi:hypothetical protein
VRAAGRPARPRRPQTDGGSRDRLPPGGDPDNTFGLTVAGTKVFTDLGGPPCGGVLESQYGLPPPFGLGLSATKSCDRPVFFGQTNAPVYIQNSGGTSDTGRRVSYVIVERAGPVEGAPGPPPKTKAAPPRRRRGRAAARGLARSRIGSEFGKLRLRRPLPRPDQKRLGHGPTVHLGPQRYSGANQIAARRYDSRSNCTKVHIIRQPEQKREGQNGLFYV